MKTKRKESLLASSEKPSLVFALMYLLLMAMPLQISALREEDLNENFFKALSHVQEIHANCKILLRTHHQVSSHTHSLSLLIC